MEEKMKWVYAAGVAALVSFAVWQYLRETTSSGGPGRHPRSGWDAI
jgi:hypothetical protein